MLAIGSLSRFVRLVATTFLLLESFARLAEATDLWPATTWEQTSPESEGIDSAVLAEAVEYVQASKVPLHSFLIVRRGRIVLDSYFYPYTSTTVHDLASATKSITSILAGIAIQNGFLKDVAQPVLPLLSSSSTDDDPRRRTVTIEDLLTMRSGFDCGLHKNEVELAAMRRASDWAAFALNLPFNAEPGTRFAYCSCNQQLISSVISAQTHLSELELARKYLFAPLKTLFGLRILSVDLTVGATSISIRGTWPKSATSSSITVVGMERRLSLTSGSAAQRPRWLLFVKALVTDIAGGSIPRVTRYISSGGTGRTAHRDLTPGADSCRLYRRWNGHRSDCAVLVPSDQV